MAIEILAPTLDLVVAKKRGDRYRALLLLVVAAWFVLAAMTWYRDGQQAEAYRLLEQNYMRETGKAPPTVTP